MDINKIIQEQKELLQQRNQEFRARLEPKLKQIKLVADKISGTVNHSLQNTLNSPWLSKLASEKELTEKAEQPVKLSPQVAKAYDELVAKLGEETHIGEWYTIEQDCINQFADVTGDNQWIHTDPERAVKESPFRAPIAHGFLTLSLIPKLTDTVNPDNNPYPDARMVINVGLNKVRFPYPVKAGARVRFRTRLIEVTAQKRSIDIVNEQTLEVENSKRLGCVAETVLRLYY
ncbi:MaoC family dehydratase [Thalassotalea maritima]|uniref:MaoC family dehydratase n=1 Tax=Thalassotalea maritima TaxID=3242416 RepID=UPI00352963E6